MIISMVDLDEKRDAVFAASMRLLKAQKRKGYSYLDLLVSDEFHDLGDAFRDLESIPGHRQYKYPEDRDYADYAGVDDAGNVLRYIMTDDADEFEEE